MNQSIIAADTRNTTQHVQGAVSIRKTVLPGMAIPMLKIRRPNGRLIFNMEIPYVDKTVFILRRGPGLSNSENMPLSKTVCSRQAKENTLHDFPNTIVENKLGYKELRIQITLL